ncbi:MAG: heme exporter protein CcmD [Candidatus Obscuribacterales bacterium]|nr:heme exporter protein CcmD [Steroidobacteraceae bacterium]
MIATYASYIWTCYGITAAVLVLNVWLARRSLTTELQATRRRQQTQAEDAQ